MADFIRQNKYAKMNLPFIHPIFNSQINENTKIKCDHKN